MPGKTNPQGGKLLTLTEVAKATGISMPTLQRYKKLYQSRIPSVGTGRRQRYPQKALAVFEEIKTENIGKRGRPKKNASAAKASPAKGTGRAPRKTRKAAAKPAATKARKTAKDNGLLSLAEVSKRTGISYPTLSRYVKQHSSKLKSEGSGRRRRFYPEAVDVFKELRSRSGRRGRTAGTASKTARKTRSTAASGADKATLELAKRVKELEKQVKSLERRLSKPIRITLS